MACDTAVAAGERRREAAPATGLPLLRDDAPRERMCRRRAAGRGGDWGAVSPASSSAFILAACGARRRAREQDAMQQAPLDGRRGAGRAGHAGGAPGVGQRAACAGAE